MGRPRMNLVGQRFGYLTVAGSADPPTSAAGNSLWLCRCDCGSDVTAKGYNLKNGNTKSCGCLQSSGSYQHGGYPRKDRTGHRYGRLVAIRYVGPSGNARGALWLCRCDCGNEITLPSSRLATNLNHSCGCGHREAKTMARARMVQGKSLYQPTLWDRNCKICHDHFIGKANQRQCDKCREKRRLARSGRIRIHGPKAENLVNRRYGSWTVIRRAPDTKGQKKPDVYWWCKCDCGNICRVRGKHLKSGVSSQCRECSYELMGAKTKQGD